MTNALPYTEDEIREMREDQKKRESRSDMFAEEMATYVSMLPAWLDEGRQFGYSAICGRDAVVGETVDEVWPKAVDKWGYEREDGRSPFMFKRIEKDHSKPVVVSHFSFPRDNSRWLATLDAIT